MASDLIRRPKRLIDHAHDLQGVLARWWGRPNSSMLSDLWLDGKPVIFLHNPKTGGKSLRRFLHVNRPSHSFANERLSLKHWNGTFSVVGVRQLFERFLSGCYARVLRPGMNGHVKLYGPEFKKASPLDFLEVIKMSPKFSGRQIQWTDYPSSQKPRADLILRHETIASWKDQMVAVGLAVADREFPHLNRSTRADSDHLSRLKLSPTEFARLELAVKDYFQCDYEAFGYAL